ncbi:MAG: hypothetical protein LBH06_00815 [Rikenellaceae bacterium]|jgi:hypothetical protein|nr:hypothetical protein [Rikenellaceae bacterium]
MGARVVKSIEELRCTAVGEIIKYRGQTIEVVGVREMDSWAGGPCNSCALYAVDLGCGHIRACSFQTRPDGTGVIFRAINE